MPGPPKLPDNVKNLRGTARPDRAQPAGVEFPTVSEPPEPPDWLPNSHAVKEWNRLAAILHAHGLLTEASLSALGHMCALHGKLVRLWGAGEAPSGHMLAQLRGFYREFGLTPASRLPEVSAPKPNKFIR